MSPFVMMKASLQGEMLQVITSIISLFYMTREYSVFKIRSMNQFLVATKSNNNVFVLESLSELLTNNWKEGVPMCTFSLIVYGFWE